jgi:hypothetical protein
VAAAVLMLLLCAGPAAHAEQPAERVGAGEVFSRVFDVAVLRPLGFLGVGTGFAFFAASAPFVAPSGHLSDAWDVFFYGPFEYTFLRPLGTF